MQKLSVFVVIVLASVSYSLPVNRSENNVEIQPDHHNIQKRFINPLFSSGGAESEGLVKIRTKRSEEECEKLQLCKLHARSNRNFLAAFQLYFVNRDNARLWDHQARSAADCEQRYSDCDKK